jgi:hypothetical protein
MSSAVIEREFIYGNTFDKRPPSLRDMAAHGPVSVLTMIQIYAHILIGLMEELRSLESGIALSAPEETNRIQTIVRHIVEHCVKCNLRSALKQIRELNAKSTLGTITDMEFRAMVSELRKRISQDLEDQVFLSLTDPNIVDRFYTSLASEDFTAASVLVEKEPDEIFGSSACARFSEARDDMKEASRCFVASRYPASVFHLMRVVEAVVIKLARLVHLEDTTPSWGSVLQKVEKIVNQTAFKDLDESVRPRIIFIRSVLPHMQAIQRAWRNEIIHIGGKLIPQDARIGEQTADEIFRAVQVFMRQLAEDFPENI